MYEPGTYEAISNVNIRRQPRVTPENWMGRIEKGTQREIYSIITNDDNTTWGRISEADGAGISQWICIKGLNRTYMQLVSNHGEIVNDHDKLIKLIEWAKTKGYVE